MLKPTMGSLCARCWVGHRDTKVNKPCLSPQGTHSLGKEVDECKKDYECGIARTRVSETFALGAELKVATKIQRSSNNIIF